MKQKIPGYEMHMFTKLWEHTFDRLRGQTGTGRTQAKAIALKFASMDFPYLNVVHGFIYQKAT